MTARHRSTFPERSARAAYSAVFRLLAPVVLARAWWRGAAEPLYRAAFTERWGWYRSTWRGAPNATTKTLAMALTPIAARPLWIHAVSLGETLAAAPLIDALRDRDPSLRLLLTHGTATGRAAGAKLLQQGDVQTWLPIDTPGAAARFLDHFRPVVGVLMETEIWPNLMHAAARRHLPMVLANGRLSARSLRSGRRVALVLRPAFEQLTLALAQSNEDAVRLREAGVAEVRVAGNLKFDLEPEPARIALGRRWRALLRDTAAPRGVVLAAVTREGEEASLLDAWQKHASPSPVELPVSPVSTSSTASPLAPSPSSAPTAGSSPSTSASGSSSSLPASSPPSTSTRPLFVIVPRHPQRFDEVADLIKARGFTLARRSAWRDEPPPDALGADVWLGDSMREMAAWYSMADVALLGGSFEPLGGQNLIEAAACGCPVVVGPHTFNFAAAAAGALEAGAARRVADVDEGIAAAFAMLDPVDPDQSIARSSLARAFAEAHRGAAARMADAIVAVIGSP